MKYLIDTNILSELFLPSPNSGVLGWAEEIERVAISVISVEEIFYGLRWRPKPRVKARIEEVIESFCDVLEVNDSVARACALMRGDWQRRGQTRQQSDMLIAATARVHQLTLVTRNIRDFEGCGVAVLNPFQPDG